MQTVSTEQDDSMKAGKRQRLSDLYGGLRATHPYPGKETIREQIGQALGSRTAKILRGRKLSGPTGRETRT